MLTNDTFFSKKRTLRVGGNLIDMDIPVIMGIINITPDSFYAESRFSEPTKIINEAQKMMEEGASIIDIGAYSSRPDASDISISEEKARLEPALYALRNSLPNAILSIDTFRSEIASWAVNNYNINIINDISAGNLDPDMFSCIAQLHVAYIAMHMRGTPQDMQNNCKYQNVTKEVIYELSEKVAQLKLAGVCDIIIDPGFGFSKNISQNYELLSNLKMFQFFELPIIVGLSRKSMIYKTLNTDPANSLNGTTTLNTIALINGADILRVHDVKEAKEAIILTQKLLNSNSNN